MKVISKGVPLYQQEEAAITCCPPDVLTEIFFQVFQTNGREILSVTLTCKCFHWVVTAKSEAMRNAFPYMEKLWLNICPVLSWKDIDAIIASKNGEDIARYVMCRSPKAFMMVFKKDCETEEDVDKAIREAQENGVATFEDLEDCSIL